MLIREAIDKIKDYCNGTNPDGSPISAEKTRDQILWGADRLDQECTGIVTCIWASTDVIREAKARGANLVIPHEALFWNHGDHTDWLAAQRNRAFLAKTALMDEAGIVVWRCHDYIHSGIPMADGSWSDGIFWGLANRLGWKPVGAIEPLAMQPAFLVTELDGRPASQLAEEVVEALGTNGLRLIGSPDTPVHKVGVAMHMLGPLDNAMITAMETEGVDCLLAMETSDYTLLQYVQDSSQTGIPKCVLSCGHFNIEDPGMAAMVEWLPAALGEDAPAISYVKAGDHFQYVIGRRA